MAASSLPYGERTSACGTTIRDWVHQWDIVDDHGVRRRAPTRGTPHEPADLTRMLVFLRDASGNPTFAAITEIWCLYLAAALVWRDMFTWDRRAHQRGGRAVDQLMGVDPTAWLRVFVADTGGLSGMWRDSYCTPELLSMAGDELVWENTEEFEEVAGPLLRTGNLLILREREFVFYASQVHGVAMARLRESVWPHRIERAAVFDPSAPRRTAAMMTEYAAAIDNPLEACQLVAIAFAEAWVDAMERGSDSPEEDPSDLMADFIADWAREMQPFLMRHRLTDPVALQEIVEQVERGAWMEQRLQWAVGLAFSGMDAVLSDDMMETESPANAIAPRKRTKKPTKKKR